MPVGGAGLSSVSRRGGLRGCHDPAAAWVPSVRAVVWAVRRLPVPVPPGPLALGESSPRATAQTLVAGPKVAPAGSDLLKRWRMSEKVPVAVRDRSGLSL